MFKNFRDLLSEPTVIILGAGASRDYDFPLWGDLKDLLLEKCRENPFPDQIRTSDLREISTALNKMKPDETVDQIATEFGSQTYTAFRLIMGLTLIESEAKDLSSNKRGWLESFVVGLSGVLIEVQENDYPLAKTLMSNLRFISLNYDRVFQQRFCQPLFEVLSTKFTPGNGRKLLDAKPRGMPQVSQIGIFSVYQPHGLIAQHSDSLGMGLNRTVANDEGINIQRVLNYGDIGSFRNSVANGWQPNITAVDDFDPNDLASLPSYKFSDQLLNKNRFYLAGLSEEGIQNSKFNFEQVKSVGTNLSTKGLCNETRKKLGSALEENRGSTRMVPLMEELASNSK